MTISTPESPGAVPVLTHAWHAIIQAVDHQEDIAGNILPQSFEDDRPSNSATNLLSRHHCRPIEVGQSFLSMRGEIADLGAGKHMSLAQEGEDFYALILSIPRT